MFVPPAVAGNLVFIGSCSGTFYALDVDSGEPAWTYDIRKDGKQTSFHGGILLQDGRVLFGADHSCDPTGIGHVYAAEQATGRVAWKYRSPAGVSSNLLRVRNFVCFGTTAAEWGCIDADTGKLQWKTAPLASSGCELPKWAATDGALLFVVAPDGAVLAYDRGGKVIWKRNLGARASTSILLHRGVIYLGATDQRIYALNAATGAITKSVAVGVMLVGRPAVSGEMLLFFANDADGRGRLFALGIADMRVKWNRQNRREYTSEEPHIWRNVVVAGDCGGAVSAFSSADGTQQWERRVNGCIRSISSSGDLLLVGAQEGSVYALRP